MIITTLLLLVFGASTALGMPRYSSLRSLQGKIPEVSVPSIDAAAEASAAASERSLASAPRFAIPFTGETYNAAFDGLWEEDDGGWSIWKLRIQAPGALHINLGFSEYVMPSGGSLHLIGLEGTVTFTDADNKHHRQLWTPIVMGSVLDLEVNLPPGTPTNDLALELSAINSGFRGFTSAATQKSGSCNVDVVCPAGDDWRDEISSVAVYGQNGSIFCTGTLINNALNDRKPYFLTADHCGVGNSNAAQSVVAYWNYETSTCNGTPNGMLNQFTTGASFIATSPATDFTLLLLDESPQEAWNIYYAGWDRSGSAMDGAVAIHHPSVDEKRISFENDAPVFVNGFGFSTPRSTGPAIKIIDWDVGTTEPGSSGSALFNLDHRIVGQLYGGAAACGNNSPDWYGSLYESWTGDATPSSRLSDWLDPEGNDIMQVDTIPNVAAPTDPPVAATEPPIAPTDSPVAPTEPPVAPTEPPVTPMESPVTPTTPPGDPTEPPSAPSSPPASAPTDVQEEPITTPAPAPVPTGGPNCFSGYNTVEVQGKGWIGMTELQIGDRVRTCGGDYSLVYSFFHKHADMLAQFIRITMADGNVLEVSSDHLLYANGSIVRAADVKKGDSLPKTVVAIDSGVHRRGLYAPVTQSGEMVVSGACSSSYVALWQYHAPSIQNWATHAAMAVFRLACSDNACLHEAYDSDTGFGSHYSWLIVFIAWMEDIGGKGGTILVTLLGMPWLGLLYMLEQAWMGRPLAATCFATGAMPILLAFRRKSNGKPLVRRFSDFLTSQFWE